MSLLQKSYLPTELILKILAYLPGEQANAQALVTALHPIYNANKNWISYNILRTNGFACDLNIAYEMYKLLKRYRYYLTGKDQNTHYLRVAYSNHVDLLTLMLQNSAFVISDKYLNKTLGTAVVHRSLNVLILLVQQPRIKNHTSVTNDKIKSLRDMAITRGMDEIACYLTSIALD